MGESLKFESPTLADWQDTLELYDSWELEPIIPSHIQVPGRTSCRVQPQRSQQHSQYPYILPDDRRSGTPLWEQDSGTMPSVRIQLSFYPNNTKYIAQHCKKPVLSQTANSFATYLTTVNSDCLLAQGASLIPLLEKRIFINISAT